jgi:hypothetical protein
MDRVLAISLVSTRYSLAFLPTKQVFSHKLGIPPDWQASPALEAAGKAYYEFRAALMVRNDEA